MSKEIKEEHLKILDVLKENNNRDWFQENKKRFKKNQSEVKAFFNELFLLMNQHDVVDSFKIFRIYRDVRFSKNKLPYKTHFAASFHRQKPELRGGYYVHIEPNDKSFIATGFWNPEKDDLFRIRKELEIDAQEFRDITLTAKFKKHWGELKGEELKSAPRDFDKSHQDIDLIRKKQFIFTKEFKDKEVTSPSFLNTINEDFKAIRPFFDYMSDVLTTGLNGEPLI